MAFGEDSLLKVFRKITPGINPDIAIHEVLTRAGSDHVAALYGWLEVDPADAERRAAPAGDAAAVPAHRQRRLGPRARPASATCSPRPTCTPTRSAATSPARPPGSARRWPRCTPTLAEHFPTPSDRRRRRPALADGDARAGSTPRSTSCPSSRRTPTRCAATFDARRRRSTAGTVQQIHGDLHLGQTLRTVRGWKIVDFEGEPAKPLAERVLPDSPLARRRRDAAVASTTPPRVVERTARATSDEPAPSSAPTAPRSGRQRNRDAFLAAYAGGELTADEQALLAAYVADKAVYEAVYEARNRPAWVAIPLEAVARIGAA